MNGPELMRFFLNSKLCRATLSIAVLLAGLAVAAPTAQAQGMFSPAREVNGRVITNYDVEQRITFLEILNSGAADMREEALRRLTEEAVQRDAARRLNLRVDPDELADGMSEFASRAEMSADEFVSALAEEGVDRESFESFVEAGLLWRKVVRRQFPGLIDVTDSDVARARDTVAILGSQRVLMSEIFLPTDPQFADPVRQIVDMINQVSTIDEFSQLAREYSIAGSRDQGGRLEWLPLSNLPGQLREPIGAARPGQIVGPIELSGAIAFFQVRDLESRRDIPAERVKVSYKRLLLPGGRSEDNLARVAQMQAEVRRCPELGPYARGLPEEALTETEALLQDIPQAHAVELGRINRNQITANTTEGDNLVVLMLCTRELESENRPSARQMENVVFDRRVDAMANLRVQELIADADIRDY
jgi:peptidyl-prolyl cis-trans isomerase SurA